MYCIVILHDFMFNVKLKLQINEFKLFPIDQFKCQVRMRRI